MRSSPVKTWTPRGPVSGPWRASGRLIVSFCGHEGRTQALQEVLRVEVETGVHVGKAVEGRGEGVGGGLDGPDEVREGSHVVAREVGAAEGAPAAAALGRRQ